MKIYLDLIFIENFIINFILIYQTHIIAKQKRNITTYVISAIIGAIYMVILVYLKQSMLNTFIIKILLSICMVYIAFLPKKVLILLKLLSLFYLVSFIYTGVITVICQFFSIKTSTPIITITVYIVCMIISLVVLEFQKNIFKTNVFKKGLLYKMNITIENSIFSYDAIVDTGNSVKDDTYNYNVVFMEKNEKLLKELEKNNIAKTKVITSSIDKVTEQTGYILNSCNFLKDNKSYIVKNLVIVFVDRVLNKENKFNALIGINTYFEDLEGLIL